MKVLFVTSEWPDEAHPNQVPFIVQQAKFLEGAGIGVSVFSFRGGKRLSNYLQARRDFLKQYNIEEFDLIHMHFGQSGLIPLPYRLPTVITFWGSDLQGVVGEHGEYTFAGRVLQWISKLLANYCTEVIIVSQHMAKFLAPGRSYHVVAHGVDLNLFKPMNRPIARQYASLPENGKLVLFAANELKAVKRHSLAKRSVQCITQHDNVRLITISSVRHEQVPLYMNACDVLLLTSKHEGSPTVIKEALACRLPVVSVDVGDVKEWINNIEGCFISENDDPLVIAKCLDSALSGGLLVLNNQQMMALDDFQSIEKIIDVYRVALMNKSSRGNV